MLPSNTTFKKLSETFATYSSVELYYILLTHLLMFLVVASFIVLVPPSFFDLPRDFVTRLPRVTQLMIELNYGKRPENWIFAIPLFICGDVGLFLFLSAKFGRNWGYVWAGAMFAFLVFVYFLFLYLLMNPTT